MAAIVTTAHRPRRTAATRRTALGARLAELRLARGLRSMDVAAEIGAEDSALRKWEYGLAVPKLPAFARLAAFYGLSMDDLWHGALPQAHQPRDVPPRRDKHP